MYLTDLTFIELGNKDWTDTGLINFAKHRKAADVIALVQSYQQQPYPFARVPAITVRRTRHTRPRTEALDTGTHA
jgi:hypothetical protein